MTVLPSTIALPFARATGSPFEVGSRHGAARAAELRAFLDDGLARIARLAPEPVSVAALLPRLAAYSAAIAAATPRLSEEIDGLAQGAGISREEAVLLQVRREIIGFQRVPAAGDCTTYASLTAGPGGGPVLAQTVDLNGNLDDQITVLDIGLDNAPRRALVLSFGGLLGYLGVNSDGLAIGLNLVLGGDWQPGLPPYLAIRHLLDQAGSVAEALDILPGLPLASSRSLTLCDQHSVACAEIVDNELRLVEPGVHTNHLLHPDLINRDALNVFARNSSRLRLAAGQSALAELAADAAGGGADVEQHFARLSRPPICVADTGDIRRERTVAAVVMLPDRGELHIRPGDPSRSATQSFRIDVAVRR
ncbi:MAG: C45 family autoproteolytic acyltransferase/hydrolase [Streptosporangiaceae bacterium]